MYDLPYLPIFSSLRTVNTVNCRIIGTAGSNRENGVNISISAIETGIGICICVILLTPSYILYYTTMSKQGTILFIFTSADKALNGAPIGWYLPEAAHPYYQLASHFEIDSASPKGGLAPVDHSSVENFTDDESVRFLKGDPEAKKLYSETKKIKDVNAEDYVAVFVVGGHGPMIDLSKDEDFARLAGEVS